MSRADLESIQGMLEQVIAYQKQETDERSLQNQILKGQLEVQSQQNYELHRQLSLHQIDHHNRAASHNGFCHNWELQEHLSRTVADLSKLVGSIAKQSQCECESLRRSESPSVTQVPHPVSGRQAFTLRQESVGNLQSSQYHSPSRNIYEPRRVESAYNLRNYSEANLMSRYPSAYEPLYERSLYEGRHSQLSSQYFGSMEQSEAAHVRIPQAYEQPAASAIRVDTHDSLLMKSQGGSIYHQDQNAVAPVSEELHKLEGHNGDENEQPVVEAPREEECSHLQAQEPDRQPIEQSALPEAEEAALPTKQEAEEEQPVEEENPAECCEEPELVSTPKKEAPKEEKFVPVQKFYTPDRIDVTRYLTHLAPRQRNHKNYGTNFNYGATPEKRAYSPDMKRWYLENPQSENERPPLPKYKYTSFSRKPLRYYHTLDDEDIVKEINRLKDWQNYLEDQERDYRGSAGYNHYGFMKQYTAAEAGKKEKKGAIFNALKGQSKKKKVAVHEEDEEDAHHAKVKKQQTKDNKAWLTQVLKRKSRGFEQWLATGGETPYAAFQKITTVIKTTSTRSVTKKTSKTANTTNIGTTGISGVTQDPEEEYEPTPVDPQVSEQEEAKEQEPERVETEGYGGDEDAFYEDPATQEEQAEPVPQADVFD